MVVSHKAKKGESNCQKNKMHDKLQCVFYTGERFRNMMSKPQSISLEPCQLLNPYCRHTTILPTLTNAKKKKFVYLDDAGNDKLFH